MDIGTPLRDLGEINAKPLIDSILSLNKESVFFVCHDGFPAVLIFFRTDANFSWPFDLHSISAHISYAIWVNSDQVTSINKTTIVGRVCLYKWEA